MQGYNVECSQEMIVHERDERDEEEENVFILSDKSWIVCHDSLYQ